MGNLKKLLIAFLATFYLLLSTFSTSAQNIGINTTGADPDNSALLDLSSDNKGFLITRADTANIVAPAFGLMTLSPVDSCLYMFNGKPKERNWISLGGVGETCNVVAISFSCGSPFSDDRDSKAYETVEIGSQCWMAENLAYLPSVDAKTTNSTSTPHYYVYDYDGTDVSAAKSLTNYSTSGVIYNWPAAMEACPTGWHLPSDEEWMEMEMALGMTPAQANIFNSYARGDDEGNQLKEEGTSKWITAGGTNTSGFNAIPSGTRYANGTFYGIDGKDQEGRWWASTPDNSKKYNSFVRQVSHKEKSIRRRGYSNDNGAAVRCLKD